MKLLPGWFGALAIVACFFPGSAILTAEEREAIPYIELGDYRLYMGKDSHGFAVYSTISQQWTSHNFPKHLKVKPWADHGTAGLKRGFPSTVGNTDAGPIVGFEFSEAPIDELVAVDGKGRFCKYKLDKPVKQTMKPFLCGAGILYYIADGKIFAFSARTGTWDVLEAPEIPAPVWKDGTGTQPGIETGFNSSEIGRIVVTLPFGKMTFASEVGHWKLERKAKAEEVSVPGK